MKEEKNGTLKAENKAQPKKKKDNIFKRFGKKCKEVFSELKKVSWPSPQKVIKQTSIVLGVVLVFTIVIALMDLGLSALFDLVTGALK